MYRPRGLLARTLYDKCCAYEDMSGFCYSKWYDVRLRNIPGELRKTFRRLNMDAETEAFIYESIDKSSRIFTQIWHCCAKAFLTVFMTQTSVNGLLRRGSMFVFSLAQFKSLTCWDDSGTGKRTLLDLGAGDGAVTSVIANLFDEVYVTEISHPMKVILAEKGFRILEVDEWASREDVKYDVITCLNLLDRCDTPMDILEDMKKALKPGGIVVLALVLPFRPYVEVGRPDHCPSQRLDIFADTLEEEIWEVVKNVLTPFGYEVVTWSRVPYLCEGDLRQPYYYLDDVVFVLKVKESTTEKPNETETRACDNGDEKLSPPRQTTD